MGRWILIVLALVAITGIGAYWLGPGVVPRARLELLAFDADGQFSADARLTVPDSLARGETRYALVLATRNTGQRVASPSELTLSLPGWARLLGPTGVELESTDDGDEPLHTYRFGLNGEDVEPGSLPTVINGIEGLSLVARLPSFTCRMRWDGVPEFAPMPDYDPTLIATVNAYYSLLGPRGRESGQLVMRLDPTRVVADVDPGFRVGASEIRPPQVALPPVGAVSLEGRRTVTCGAPELRYPVEAIVWKTGATGNGRLLIIASRDAPRRWMFDLDGDGRIELEAWDGDGDGLAEGRRTTSFRIPAFLIPIPAPVHVADTASIALPDSVRADSTRSDSARLDTANVPPDTGRAGGPPPAAANPTRDSLVQEALRRAELRRDSIRRALLRRDSMRLDSIRRDSIRRDSIRLDSLRRDTLQIDTAVIDTIRAPVRHPGG